ncbi:MAG TPA: DUF4124 domain-containing protein [Pseudomonadales bacterium]|nr:DUF4124 domain-containing protein [Pseudomonadales bacterium]
MKLFIKFLLFCLVAAFAGQFYVKGPDGKPLMTLEKLLGHKTGSAVASMAKNPSAEGVANAVSGNSDTIYKWKDKNGVWQFSQTPPPASGEAEKVTYNYKQNIIESPKKSEVASTEAAEPKKKRQLIMPSSAKAGSKSNSLVGGSQQATATSDNPALDMLESGEIGGPGLTTVPLDKLPALINQAKALNGVMENRTQQIDSQVDGRR